MPFCETELPKPSILPMIALAMAAEFRMPELLEGALYAFSQMEHSELQPYRLSFLLQGNTWVVIGSRNGAVINDDKLVTCGRK